MSVVTGALGNLGPKLLQLLQDEYKLQKGVREQVQWLSDELKSIYAFLHKVSNVPWDRLDEQVKLWACEVRETSYDLEDIIDKFLVRVDSSKNTTDTSSLMVAITKMGELFSKSMARHDIAANIKDMKKHLDEVAQRRQKYKLDEIMCKTGTATSSIDPRLTAMCKVVKHLIGADKSMEELISMLNESDPDDYDMLPDKKSTKKVSIVGVGGLGKTTLARAVYENLKSQYVCTAFVSVGRDLELVKVFKDILCDLDKEKYENIHNSGKDEARLICDVQEFLKNKRYFIVIDDVWDVRKWETIELSLVDNNCGSKVITTTRKVDVAKAAGKVYKLNSLSFVDSMKLFDTRIGADRDRMHLQSQPNDVSDKIIKKCAGIPLSIITMASVFAGKPECEWSEVYSSISFDTQGNRESEHTMTILSFSYYDLPAHLRTCLLYLSTYPEDYEIRKNSLIWKWIAEGFIDPKQGTRLFEVGERYFNDLVNRSLIQVVEDWDGRVSGCRVHDMVLDLMCKLSSEENFIYILGDNVEGTPALSNVRRFAHQNRVSEHVNSEALVTGMPKVRSYIAFMCCIDSRDLFLRFKLLRVLDIIGCKFKEGCRLENLGGLFHLRYLGIKGQGSYDFELPKEIGNLKLLQTLDVNVTLPARVVRLTKLVRLCAHNKIPDGIGRLVSLEELSIINSCSDNPKRFLKELSSLRELRVLMFSTDEMYESVQRDFVESLSNLQKIQKIIVRGSAWTLDTTMWEAAGFVLPRPLQYLEWSIIKLSKLPSCINSSALPNLSHLTLCLTIMDEQDLTLLASLPVLSYLKLEIRSTMTASNINTAGDGCFFQNLRYFGVNAMVQIEQQHDTSISFHIWNGNGDMPFGSEKNHDSSKAVPSGVMPNVEILGFWISLRALKVNNGDCRNIGLEYLPSLREVGGNFSWDGMSAEEADVALGVLKDECHVHPNRPTLNMHRTPFDEMEERNMSKKEKEKQEEGDGTSQTADVDVGKLSISSS